jgi:hypothetical protein|tara:strand:+ start:135 stop:284 length:150 start_codon:yes stop_codon:yes gene_type:complete
MNKKIIFVVWLVLVIVWNYQYPSALPYEDVVVTACLAFLVRYFEKWVDK